MSRSRAPGDVEADLMALHSAAERAGTALACLFSTCEEFETAVIVARRRRRAEGAGRRIRRVLWSALDALALGLALLML